MTSEREESATVAAVSASTSAPADVSQYPVDSLPIEGCVYRGEGNANLVIALPSERKVIRLRKSACSKAEEPRPREPEEARRVGREVDFIRGVISCFLGGYVHAPEILRYGPPEIARLAEKIRAARPESRRDKDIYAGYATKYPDYTFLPDHLSIPGKPTFCVEIKPKQGFIPEPDRLLKKCPYCLNQYYKQQSRGVASGPSGYCPLDLFSGQAGRMTRALKALLRSPQNNLRIFRDGDVVYDEARPQRRQSLRRWFEEDELVELLRLALLRPFHDRLGHEQREPELANAFRGIDAPNRLEPDLVGRAVRLLEMLGEECELLPEPVPRGCVMERILRMQRQHRCGADLVAWIRASFARLLGDELVYPDLSSLIADSAPQSQTAASSGEITKETKRKSNEKTHQESGNDKTTKLHFPRENENARRQLWTNLDGVVNEKFANKITTEDCLEILKKYLLFCTARDCSILVAFQELDKESIIENDSSHRIDLSEDHSFLVAVRVLDLDLKNLGSIEKHRRRDNDILRAVISQLEKELVPHD